MTEWFIWGALLLLQNASFTWVSRARNSSSVWYHGIASVCSNGVYIINLFIVANKLVDVKRADNVPLLVFTCLFYTAFTVIGSIGMHQLLMKYVERGKRRVGA